MIYLEGVRKKYPDTETFAVDSLDLHIPEGKITVLIGPSGCGKTTTLKMLNKLIVPDHGVIRFAGQDLEAMDLQKLRTNMGYAIQTVGLFPHWTVEKNVATVPRLLKWDRERTAQRVEALLSLVGLDPNTFRSKYPNQLSGGEAQRVGVARALAADPPILLMDEPFGALDPLRRAELQDELLSIQDQLRKTIVFVTHDMDEAVSLADQLVILNHGKVVQSGSPLELLAHPVNDFVRDFIGADRLLKRLSVLTIGERLEYLVPLAPAQKLFAEPAIAMGQSFKDALFMMMEQGAETLYVTGQEPGTAVARLDIHHILSSAGGGQ